MKAMHYSPHSCKPDHLQRLRCIGGGVSSIRVPTWSRGSGAPTAAFPRWSRGSGAVPVVAAIDWSRRKNERAPRPENVPGSFFVDKTCINCDTCRWMAPDFFGRVGPQSAVVAQPRDRQGRLEAMKALLSCPTFSIHVTDRTPEELRAAQDDLPYLVPGLTRTATAAPAAGQEEGSEPGGEAGGPPQHAAARPGIYYTGWASEKSFAGCAYLIVRPQGGNILVDSPRYNPVLARRIEALGGVRYMFLTHRDDVGDHQDWARHFGAVRILHQTEVNPRQGTDKVEIQLTGEGPWVLDDEHGTVVPAPASSSPAAGAGPDVTLVFTPGHTQGHVCLYYEPYKALFSGDHLASAAGEVVGAAQGQLHVMTNFNWYSVPEQLRSVAKLLQYDWLHVLPAHGRRAVLRDAAHRLAAVHDVLAEHGALDQAAAGAANTG